MNHKFSLVGADKSCSTLIISPLVALMMVLLVICEAQSFWILIILNKCFGMSVLGFINNVPTIFELINCYANEEIRNKNLNVFGFHRII